MTTFASWGSGYEVSSGTEYLNVFNDVSQWLTVAGGFTQKANSTAKLKNNTNGLLLEPDGSASCKVRYRNINLSPASRGKLGMWVYIPSVPPAGSIELIFSPLGTSEGANTIYATWTIARMKQGWNFLTWHPSGVNSSTHPIGVLTTGNGTYNTVQAILDFFSASQIGCITLTFTSWTAGYPVYFDSIIWGQRGRAKVLLGFDGKSTTNLTYTLPYFQERGFVGYVACHCDTDGSVDLTPTQVGQMDQYYDAGWDIINHTRNHGHYVNEIQTASAIQADALAMEEIIRKNGWSRGLGYFVYTEGAYSATSVAALHSVGFKIQRAGISGVNPTISDGFNGIDCIEGLTGAKEIENAVTQAQARQQIDAAILYGETTWPFWHTVTTNGDSTNNSGQANEINNAFLSSFLDYIQIKRRQGLIDVVSPSQWYRGLTQPALVA